MYTVLCLIEKIQLLTVTKSGFFTLDKVHTEHTESGKYKI